MYLFFVNTAMGRRMAEIEHMWNGRYSSGEPHATRLYTIATMPDRDMTSMHR